MKNLLPVFALTFFLHFNTSAQPFNIRWAKTLGGSDVEIAKAMQQTPDGGSIIAGESNSNNGDVSGNHGNSDAWIVKLDAVGGIQWQKSIGGSGDDYANAIQITSDGGYIMAGQSNSNDGDVSGNHGDFDAWVVKLNAVGDIEWQASLGGAGYDHAAAIKQTTDGRYWMAGSTNSTNGDIQYNHGGTDAWVVTISGNGNLQNEVTAGGSGNDFANALQATADGGCIITGFSNSIGGGISGNHGNSDVLLVKLDASGTIQWQSLIGGEYFETGTAIVTTSDGGYAVAGYSFSNDGDVSGNHGGVDYWVVKLNASGEIQWQKSLGGTQNDYAQSIEQTIDGGYIVAGWALSVDGDISSNKGNADYWVAKLDQSGNIQWQRTLGGSSFDYAHAIQASADGGYIVLGYTNSTDGDVGSTMHGNTDFWVVKLLPVPLGTDDLCGDVIYIPVDGIVHAGYSNTFATVANGENSITPFGNGDCETSWCDNSIEHSLWFTFKAPATGAVEVSTCDLAGFDTQIAVYDLNSTNCDNFSAFTLLKANDDGFGCTGYSSILTLGGLTPNKFYYIIVDGFNGETGSFGLKITQTTASAVQSAPVETLMAFPNPTDGAITIRLPREYPLESYTISDLTGRMLRSVQLEQPAQETNLNLDILPKGVYLLQVRAGQQVFSQKIVLQ